MSTAPVVAFEGVSLTFDTGVEALRDIDLTVRPGEFISILGPSGCGKSTMLRIAAGLVDYSDGRLLVDRSHIAFTFQDATLLPWRTVQRNVELLLELRNVPAAERRRIAQEKIALVGLGGFEEQYPKHLSGGMKMRVSIARALVTRPRLLLMDEPFAALDEMTRIKLNNDLLAIWREHRFSVIFVTHSVYESVYLSNRIVVMAARPGRVIDEIRIDEPYPRGEAFRTSGRYNAHCTAVSESLHGALHGVDIDH